MPKSVASYYSLASETSRHAAEDDDLEGRQAEALRNSYLNAARSTLSEGPGPPSSASPDRRLRIPIPQQQTMGERTPLLWRADEQPSGYSTRNVSVPSTPGRLRRNPSYTGSIRRNHSRRPSAALGMRFASALSGSVTPNHDNPPQSNYSALPDDGRDWYNQFTSTDWVRDSIADAFRVKELRSRKDRVGRLIAVCDGATGWILVAFIGVITAGVTYFIDVAESILYDYKYGYCSTHFWYTKTQCCQGGSACEEFHAWSDFIHRYGLSATAIEFLVFNGWVILFALLSCFVTLQTKTTISSAISLPTMDENLGAGPRSKSNTEGRAGILGSAEELDTSSTRTPTNYYPAAGSGVAEVKVILSGFVLHGYLGVRTLICKILGLILSVASGLSLGKEGPYVHIATCIGNIASRFVPKYRDNDAKRREILSASAAAGVAVAFGAPIAGVLFSGEEVSYYFPPKVLFRTFFCCIIAALSLRFLDPYGTGKIVLFQVKYLTDWHFFEIGTFAFLGICGGFLGALFIKGARAWGKTFRRVPMIKKYPMFEVFLVALATGLCSFWNRFTRLPVAELLFELAAPCNAYSDTGMSLCPTEDRIPNTIRYLCIAFVIKAGLTLITFGLKLPAGIYVPSMVVGGILGRIVGHFVQLLVVTYPDSPLFASCPVTNGQRLDCITPGVYALAAAGATMCGVTRLSVTLAVILFELTGSLEYVLPFSLAVMLAKWTSDLLEPSSIYDLLTDLNAYPYLDAKVRPIFTTDLGDIVEPPLESSFIDISISPLVPASELRSKLTRAHAIGEVDGGFPILKGRALVGMIPAADLEFALDRLESEESALCLMSTKHQWPGHIGIATPMDENEPQVTDAQQQDPTNFTPYIDPAPVALDISSPMDLVFECFVKLGLRYICVLREGRFCGMVHKKAFVRYVKRVEEESKRR